MNPKEMTPPELALLLRDAIESQDNKTIKAVKEEFNRRSKYDE